MNKLEVGMYIRTKNLGIEKIINVFDKNHLMNICGRIQTKNYGLDEEDIIKASHNIIDLIEVGDYVNGCYVEDVKETFVNITTGSNYFQRPSIFEEDIKSIVTSQQFESMSYKVGE